MLTREGMRSLGQGIIGSYEARVKGVAQVRKATQEQQRKFHEANQARAQQQRAHLAQAEAQRSAEGKKMRGALAQAEAQRSAEVKKMRGALAQVKAQRSAEVKGQLGDMAAVHAGAREEWQRLSRTMEAKRAGKPVAAEARPREVPAPPAEPPRKRGRKG